MWCLMFEGFDFVLWRFFGAKWTTLVLRLFGSAAFSSKALRMPSGTGLVH